MMKKVMLGSAATMFLALTGCNAEGAIVIGGISVGLLGGAIEVVESILQIFGLGPF
jgi:hypothetical protein